MVMRLDKLLAHYGIGTRKEVKNYIRKGFVTVNGSIIKKDDFKVDYETDKIIFDGELITYKPYVYIMLNKPAGYVSATKDNVHPTVVDLIYGYEQYDLFPVGRLDLDTEGLLLLTNDGDFAHKLLAPSRHHSKLYYACVEGIMDENDILKFKEGITIDHYRCQSSNLSIIKTEDNTSEVLIEIFEGKFHQVKKMVESVGKKVTYLKRLQMKNMINYEKRKFRRKFMNKLVVYFSYTGNTKLLATTIREKLNCDILEIKTVIPYSEDYDTVVNDEQNSEASNHLPEIQEIGIDLSKYDEIILGTPVWWYRPVPAIRTFLNQNDLSGKTIKPFATNAGWLGKTFKEIRTLCPNSEICEGMNIVFESYSDKLVTKEQDIENWIKTL